MGLFVSVKRYVGVRYYESEKRRWAGKPDRCYYIRYPDGAGTKREKVGWSSEGVDAAFASRERAKRIAGDRKPIRGTPTLAQAWDEYFSSLKNIPSSSNYENRWSNWLAGELGPKKVDKITEQEVVNLVNRVLETRSHGTAWHVLGLLKRILRFAVARKWIQDSPALHIVHKIPDNSRLKFFTREEADAILDRLLPANFEAYALCVVSLETGARLKEALRIEANHVQFATGTLALAKTKNGTTRHAFMTQLVTAVLKELSSGKNGRLFSMSKAPLIIERTIDDVCNQGVEDPRYIAVFHTFRHTFASWLTMSGQVTPFELMELMGHKSLALTERYVHLMPSAKERGVKAVFG